MGFGDANAEILDTDGQCIKRVREVYDNSFCTWRVFHGVGDQVDQHLPKALSVADDLPLSYSLNADLVLRGCMLQVLYDLADEQVNVNCFLCECQFPRLDF